MNTDERVAAYLAQTGKKELTPRQARRARHKDANVVLPGTAPTESAKANRSR
jgi:hypothetical protein